jgi:hypothetical protein
MKYAEGMAICRVQNIESSIGIGRPSLWTVRQRRKRGETALEPLKTN